MRWTRWPRGRDLKFLGKSSFVDLARLLLRVGSKEREEEGWSWAGLGWDQEVAWSFWQSGAASSSARKHGVEATFRLLACQSRISAS